MNLETPEARRELEPFTRYCHHITKQLALIYHKNTFSRAGIWSARLRQDRKYKIISLGKADDFAPASEFVLNFEHAVAQAKKFAARKYVTDVSAYLPTKEEEAS